MNSEQQSSNINNFLVCGQSFINCNFYQYANADGYDINDDDDEGCEYYTHENVHKAYEDSTDDLVDLSDHCCHEIAKILNYDLSKLGWTLELTDELMDEVFNTTSDETEIAYKFLKLWCENQTAPTIIDLHKALQNDDDNHKWRKLFKWFRSRSSSLAIESSPTPMKAIEGSDKSKSILSNNADVV